jgi:hypothetical protein
MKRWDYKLHGKCQDNNGINLPILQETTNSGNANKRLSAFLQMCWL